jgi:hypothetical protein
MLGELLYEASGKRTARRVVSTEPLEVEVSFEGAGKVLGMDSMEIGTYQSLLRDDGTIYGEGEGVVMTLEGDRMTWKGAGAGKFGDRGAVSYRGAIFYTTASAKLARFNGIAAVFEFETDENGNTRVKVWEWK